MPRSLLGAMLFLLAVAALTFVSVRFVLGRLPGDIVVDRGGTFFYAPFTTAILISLVLSLVLWLIRR
jgi:uncharacterized membrane protein YvlD (DUF360 family)